MSNAVDFDTVAAALRPLCEAAGVAIGNVREVHATPNEVEFVVFRTDERGDCILNATRTDVLTDSIRVGVAR